jgi:hypothetical protein
MREKFEDRLLAVEKAELIQGASGLGDAAHLGKGLLHQRLHFGESQTDTVFGAHLHRSSS